MTYCKETLTDGIYYMNRKVKRADSKVVLYESNHYLRLHKGALFSHEGALYNGNNRRWLMSSVAYCYEYINGVFCRIEYRFIEKLN